MTISNKLTIFRIILVPFFVWVLLAGIKNASLIAAAIFIVASVTDWLDGYLARKRNEITDFGKFADPIADKILTISAFVCFVQIGIVPAWSVIIIIAREFIVSALRMSAASKNEVIAADKFGKVKTVVQMLAIIFILLDLFSKFYVPLVLFYFSVILTVMSGTSYIFKYKHLLFD